MSKLLTPLLVDAPQRSAEWFEARLGKVTGSMVGATMSYYVPNALQVSKAETAHEEMATPPEIIERLKKEYPFELVVSAGIALREKADRKAYRQNIVGERLTHQPAEPERFATYAMRWGIMNEPLALALYQLKSRSIIENAPFMMHPDLMCGASPDGLVTDPTTGELGNVEVKCLLTANHLYKIMFSHKVPKDYTPQIQMQMWISGRSFCDFVGFDSRLPEGLKIHTERVPRDEFYIDYVLVPNVMRFLDECETDFLHFWAMVTENKK